MNEGKIKMQKKKTPPGPKGLFLLGNTLQFARDPLGFLTRTAREYGDIAKMKLLQGEAYLLSNPDHIEYVLTTTNRNFKRDKGVQLLRPLLGNGLVLSEGSFWLRQRRLMQPVFHRERIKTYAEIMVNYAEQMMSGWQNGEIRDIRADMQKLTQQIVTRLLFSVDLSSEEAHTTTSTLDFTLKEFQRRLANPFHLPEFIPTPRNRKYKRSVAEIDQIIKRIVQERRQAGEDKGDLLSVLLAAQDDEGNYMTDQQLRDELITLYLAGHETTALTLSWAWALLAQHPQVEAKLVAELNHVLGNRTPTINDLPHLPYLDTVIKETLRLYPIAWFNNREVLQEVEVGGYRLTPGLQLWMTSWIMHRNPRYWEAPDEFKPERWSEEKVKELPKYAYMPFGGGPRICIGNSFSLTETALVLATVLQHYRLNLVEGTKVEIAVSGTLNFKYPLQMVVTPRQTTPIETREAVAAR
jgi:cytochrome P450